MHIRRFNLKQENNGTINIGTVSLIIYLNFGSTQFSAIYYGYYWCWKCLPLACTYIRSNKHIIHYTLYFIS